jgi:maleylpyruvate isomerase
MDGATAVGGARDAHVQLVRALESAGFDDALARRPSALPGWTVGHVITHLARNGDSHTRMIEAAKLGAPVAQYGEGQRDREIAAGAGRSAAALLDDLCQADDALLIAYNTVDADTWAANALRWDRAWPVSDLPFLRWREVALHTADLGLPGIGNEIWAPAYVDHELRRQVGGLAVRLPAATAVRLAANDSDWSTVVMAAGDELPREVVTVDGSLAGLLAWTVGRSTGEIHGPALTPWRGAP